ncbi:HlyD family efflux transporter periplasmic adaptor subunit [Sutterella sp.]|uniref:HlyD family efflux transporter periplasmic adaptor subunit n=1 Tax=Sutterella sp. TaxID=1981025 RepID=UPI0026DF064F|nr:HlyD family efflux transporter periplasmic adaptor subunit [Sutterella sp.]MDO5532472.1 efflux RND transporter periplasmic adaptor subunit [Sutterella sp.]
MKVLRILIVLVVIAALGALAWHLRTEENAPPPARAWGNVDTRQISLAFEASGRILEMNFEEGERVKKGDVLGRLDTRALEIERRQLAAELDRAREQASLSREGYRSEDIEAARASARALESRHELARRTWVRQKELVARNVSSQQNLDDARFSMEAAERELAASRAQLAAYEAGLRPQEVASAEAAVRSAEAAVAAADYQIGTASVLVAPADGIIRTRTAEPGDMGGPSRTVYQLSIVSPKWIRCWITERQLALVKEGSRARVTTDTAGTVEARVSWISSTAEFTPKTVQTEDLRTALVYEVRLETADAENRLRLGQPVTVDFIE